MRCEARLAADTSGAFAPEAFSTLGMSSGRAQASYAVAVGGTRGVTTTHKIKKELSICQSLLCLDLVSFPVLSQIKPQAPRLVRCSRSLNLRTDHIKSCRRIDHQSSFDL